MYQDLFRLQEEIFKVLANQKRLEIIQLLHGRPLSVNEIALGLGLRQANISQHLSLLRQHRLVRTRRRGRRIYYSLTDETIGEAASMVREFLKNQYNVSASELDKLTSDETEIYPVTVDPVCGLRLSVRETVAEYSYDSQTYQFCSPSCYRQFHENPSEYAPAVSSE